MNPAEDFVDGFFDPQRPLAHISKQIIFTICLLIGVILYYVLRYSKGLDILKLFYRISPPVLIGMIILESLYVLFQGGLLQNVYRTVGSKHSLFYLTIMYLGMNLVNTIAPVIGLSGSIYMMHFEKKYGLHRSETLLINFLYYLTDYTVFMIVLIIGLIYLLIAGQITRTIIITSLIFSIFVAIVFMFSFLIFSHPTALHRFINFISKLSQKLFFWKKTLFLPETRILEFVNSTQSTWERSRSSWRYLIKSAIYAFGLHLVCLLLLWLSFLTFQIQPSLQILVAGYTVGTLLNIVSITPGGIGFAEGGMTAVFAALGVPVEQALVVALLYRTFFAWYPLLLGLGSLHLLPIVARQEQDIRLK